MFWRVSVGNAHARHSDANTFLFLSFLVILCFFIILSLPLSVFPYFILGFFLLSPSLMLFFVFYHSITPSFCVSLCYSLFLPSITFSYVILCFLSFYHSLFLCFLMLFFVSSFYHLLLCYYLFFYHYITPSFCVSLCYSLFLPSITFSYVIICFFYHYITPSFCVSLCFSLFLPSITFSYVILCFFYHSITPYFCISLCYSLFLSFYHFLFLSFLMLFFVFIILSLSLSVFPYVILCFFLLSLSLSVFPYVIPYVIIYFFLLSPSLMLFFVYIVLSFSLRTTSSSAREVTSPNIAMLQLRAFILAKHAKTRQNTPKDHTSIWNVLELAFLPVMRSCPW